MEQEFELVIKDGHTDVASAKRQMKKIQEDIVDIYTSLTSKKEEEDLPSWWNNKLAVSAAYLNSLNGEAKNRYQKFLNTYDPSRTATPKVIPPSPPMSVLRYIK